MRSETWKNKHTESLVNAILSLKDEKEAENFFRDLLTLEEIREMSKRWRAARMLDKGEPYREVAKKVGLSTSTVVRVAHWLKHGKGGYRAIINRVMKSKKNDHQNIPSFRRRGKGEGI